MILEHTLTLIGHPKPSYAAAEHKQN